MYSLQGKVALVTGAARGIGAATAKVFLDHGAQVLASDLHLPDPAPGAEPAIAFTLLDVTDPDHWARAVDQALATFGRLDILVNNAGIFQPAPIQATDVALMDRHYRVNQLGVFLGMQAVLAPMQQAGGGSIINLSSQAGLQGHPNMLAYAASKWASRGMTRAAAVELAPHRIRVNSIHPGGIDTPIHGIVDPAVIAAYTQAIPLKRFGTAEEVAAMALYLAADASAYVTGAEFAIAGGLGV